MAELRKFPQAGLYAARENVARKVAPAEHPAAGVEKYCVYNQTRERFVATGVEAVGASLDVSLSGAEARLRSLQPGTGTGLWILPCPEISPTSIRLPVDLVYLNHDGAVLIAIQSFPLGGPAVSSAIANSLLVLPENTVIEGEIHVGDRMIVAAADEMKRYLQSMKEAKAAAQQTSPNFLEQFLLSSAEEQTAGAAEKAMLSEGHHVPVAPAAAQRGADEAARSMWVKTSASGTEQRPDALKVTPAGACERKPDDPAMPSGAVESNPAAVERSSALPAAIPPATAQIAVPEPLVRNNAVPQVRIESLPESQPWKKTQAKGWLARMFNSKPEDARVSVRESLPGLIAYYFTGGTPMPHAVRDISPKGMYIVTEERWYPGTVVRVTLTDRHDPKVERSITVNAKAVRAGSDGVGFEFVIEDINRRTGANSERMEQAIGMDPEQVEEFLRTYKS